jgi:uncharacterized protein YdaU (DUF1376 family)
MGAPWFKLFPRDYLTDSKVRLLSREHRSILLDLWCYCAMDGSIPKDPESIARLLGEPIPSTKKAMEKLNGFFLEEGCALYSRRLRVESEAYEEKCQKLRENGSKGGRPKKPEGKPKGSAKGNQGKKPDGNQNGNHQPPQKAPEAETEAEKIVQTPDGVCGGAPAPPPPEPEVEKAEKPKKAKREKPKDPEDQSLEEILGGKTGIAWERFWKTMQVWNRDKLFAPKKLARAWLKACTKADAKLIYVAALSYRDEFLAEKRGKDETQFMKNPLEWLEEEGWTVQGVEPELAEAANA